MVGKRLILLAGIIFFCFSTSLGQYTNTFKWTDTIFNVGSKRIFLILWDPNGHSLHEDGRMHLDTIVNFMKRNISLQIGVNFYTDQQGIAQMNIKLTQARAQSCVNYIISHGIDSARLIPKGWGSANPIVSMNVIKRQKTKRQRDSCYQINRRTEIVILKTAYKK